MRTGGPDEGVAPSSWTDPLVSTPPVVSLKDAAESFPAPGHAALPLGPGGVRFANPVGPPSGVDRESRAPSREAREAVVHREEAVAPHRIGMPPVGGLEAYGSVDPNPTLLCFEEVLEDDPTI